MAATAAGDSPSAARGYPCPVPSAEPVANFGKLLASRFGGAFPLWQPEPDPRAPSCFRCGRTVSLPRVIQSKTGMAQPRSSAGRAGLFSTPTSVVSFPNVPHQSLDRYRYPPRALRRYSVPDARKRDFADLCQRPFRPGVPTLSFHIEADIDAEIGARLAEVRRWRGLTQRQLAKAVGVTITTIQNWERGRHAISAKRFGPLADALYCQPLDLLMLPRAHVGVQKIMGYSKSNP